MPINNTIPLSIIHGIANAPISKGLTCGVQNGNSLNSEFVLEIRAGKITDTQQSKTIVTENANTTQLSIDDFEIRFLFISDNF